MHIDKNIVGHFANIYKKLIADEHNEDSVLRFIAKSHKLIQVSNVSQDGGTVNYTEADLSGHKHKIPRPM